MSLLAQDPPLSFSCSTWVNQAISQTLGYKPHSTEVHGVATVQALAEQQLKEDLQVLLVSVFLIFANKKLHALYSANI